MHLKEMPSVTEIFRLLFGPPKERLDTNELPRWVEAHKINEKCVHRITLSRMVVSLSRNKNVWTFNSTFSRRRTWPESKFSVFSFFVFTVKNRSLNVCGLVIR